MKNNICFSVIVPIYNVKPFINRCMESLLAQGRDDYEVILVDDGSTDGCSEIADSYAKKYPFVSCLHKENGGLSSARNEGLQHAKGKYVLFVDSDDWIDKNALNVLTNYIMYDFPDIIKFNYIRMPSGNIKKTIIESGLYEKEQIQNELLPMALEKTGDFIFSAWSYLYKRELLEKCSLSFISERVIGSEDYQFNTNVFLHANSILAIDDALYFYDYREGSLTARYRPKLIEQYQNLQKELIKICAESGELEKYKMILNKSYVWRCFSTCIRNEVTITNGHSFWDGYYNCKKMFSSKIFRDAVRKVDFSKEPIEIRIRYYLMRINLVFPLVYSQWHSNKKVSV